MAIKLLVERRADAFRAVKKRTSSGSVGQRLWLTVHGLSRIAIFVGLLGAFARRPIAATRGREKTMRRTVFIASA